MNPFLEMKICIRLHISNLAVSCSFRNFVDLNLLNFKSFTWFVPLKCALGVSVNDVQLAYKTFDVEKKDCM